jgi:esterase/lipase superfamily enzyme
MRRMLNMIRNRLYLLAATVLLASCGSQQPFAIDIMPAPDVFDEGNIDPFADATPIGELPYSGILYATDRQPATEEDKQKYYLNERGDYLRLGRAGVTLADTDVTWEEARKVSLLKNRGKNYPITVKEVEEYGPLDRSATPFRNPDELGDDAHAPAARFAAAVNAKLALSKRKHIYIYTHGYRVIFENPILVGMELWHFLGYDGVFVAYAWPSTPSRWAYLKDTETAAGYARNLRIFLEYLAEETDADEIHVIGYSAGTRLVSRAFEQLALIHTESTPEKIREELRIGNLMLIGSDVDRQVFGSYMADGLLEIPRHLTVYVSEQDKALRFSRLVTRRERLGQLWAEHPAHLDDYLNEREADVSVINVTEAEGGTTGNGHQYFRQSPWASSDVLMTLAYDLPPADRGLVHQNDTFLWTFPPDYIERLRRALAEANPGFKAAIDDKSTDNVSVNR